MRLMDATLAVVAFANAAAAILLLTLVWRFSIELSGLLAICKQLAGDI